MISASDLFKKAKFYSLKRSEDLSEAHAELLKKISTPDSFNKFHPERAREYLLGRLCANNAFGLLTGTELLNLPTDSDRSPMWPPGFVGSISHDKNWVGVAVANCSDLIGLGIDFEVKGRAKLEVKKQITNSRDITSCANYSDEELITIIFSIKECLYKALYPSVKMFFGFEDAAVTALDPIEKTFSVALLKDLSEDFCLNKKYLFKGRYLELPESILTVLEIHL